MTKSMIVIGAGCAGLGLSLWLARGCATPSAGDAWPAGATPPSPVDANGVELSALERSSARSDAATAGTTSTGPAAEVVLDDAALLAQLRAVARAFLDHDEPALRSGLEALLAGPRTPRRVLALLEALKIESGSLEEEGALLCASFGAAVEARGRSLALDGRDFRADYLDVLARLDPMTGEPFAEFTAHLSVNDRPCLGVAWVATISRLRAEHPEHASTFDPLLTAILESGAEITTGRDMMPALTDIVSASNDPLAVQVALSALVAIDPDNYVPIAERMFAESSAADGLAGAVVEAVARHAPVDAASASLAKLAREDQYAAFADFGGRAGAVEAAQSRYNELVASDADPRARKMLVSAMRAERPEVLLGIAETDRSADVRGQALLTLTLRPLETTAALRTLRGLHAARGGENGLSTRSSLPVAENVALNSFGAVRDDAIAFLRDVATDPNESARDRRDAWDRLRSTAHPDEIAGSAPPP